MMRFDKQLMEGVKSFSDYLKEHLFVGMLGDGRDHLHTTSLVFSLSESHWTMTVHNDGGGRTYLVGSKGRLLHVQRSVHVVEGVVYIVDDVE